MATPTAPRASLNGPSYQVVKFQTNRPASVPTITAGIDLINALFQGEKLSGAQVFNGAAANSKLDSFDLLADKKVTLKVAVASDKKYAYNVMAMVEGRDPVLKNEYIVMSAHLDHIGLSAPDANGDGVNNGADDDASGCVALMGMARAYATGAAKGMRPKRTMIFLWMAGEEKGLWGSQYFNQFPPVDITKVVADLNMDMIGRSKTAGYVDPPSYKLTEPNEVFVVGPRVASDELGKIVQTVNSAYLKMKLSDFYDTVEPDATHDNLGPGTSGQRIFSRSDHYNFVKMGIPIAFFTDGLHVDYHRVTDSAEKIDYDKLEAVTKTVYAVGWVLGNSATRPKLNDKLPDQLVNDMKNVKDQGWGKLTPIK
jgi:Zn-dependent M28 family amino/carboxypeptidase